MLDQRNYISEITRVSKLIVIPVIKDVIRLAIVFVAGLLLFSCSDDELREAKHYDDMQDRPAEITKAARIIYSDSARITATLEASRMERFRDDKNKIVITDGLKMIFYDPHPQESARVTANQGERLINEQKTILRNDVVVINEAGDTLETEYLVWEEQKDLISSDKTVKVTTEDEIIIGEGFESDPSFKEYTFYKITGTLEVEQ